MKKSYLWLVIVSVAAILAVIIIIFASDSGLSIKKSLKPLKLTETNELKVVSSDCYGFLLPKVFLETNQHGCNYNAYAENLKDNWINIDTYDEELDINQLKTVFLKRKIDPEWQEIIKEKPAKLGGLQGIMIIDRYKNNGATYATILVPLRPRWYMDGKTRTWAIELRGHYSSDEDKKIFENIAASWQWR